MGDGVPCNILSSGRGSGRQIAVQVCTRSAVKEMLVKQRKLRLVDDNLNISTEDPTYQMEQQNIEYHD